MSPLFRHLCAAVLLLASSVSTAAELPAVASFFNEPDVKFVELSPSGHYVAVLNRMPDGKQVLAVRDTTDLKKVTVAASFDSARVVRVHWINDNRIGFTLKNAKLDFIGNLDEFAVDRDGENIIHLIAGSWNHEQQRLGSSVKDKLLTAEYAYFRATNDGSDDIIVAKYMFNNIDMQPEALRLYRLNTRTRQLRDLLPANQPAFVKSWLLDADNQPRIAMAEAKGRCVVWYRKADGEAWSELNSRDCYNDPGFWPVLFDSQNTLYVSAGYHGRAALFAYDLNKKEMAKEPFVDIDGFDFDGDIEQDLVSHKVVGVHVQADAAGTVWLDPGMDALQKKINALLPQTANSLTCPNDCSHPAALVVQAGSDRRPAAFYLYTPADGKLVGLGGAHPDIQPAQMGRRDFDRFAARDGLQIPVYITMPPASAAKPGAPLPTVLLVHGGPYVRGASWEWDAEAQFLASRGYVVLQPQFRGSTGFGAKHFRAGWKQWGRAMQDDLADTVAWAVGKGYADPKRVAIMGASYGGYATLMGLIRDPQLFKCGVEWAGVTDLAMMLNSVESDLSADARRYDMRTLVGDPDKDAAQFAQFSPLQRAGELKQPLLMAHGGQDSRVPIAHAAKFKAAVNNRNIEWVVYPEEGHGWRNESTRLDFWTRVEAFLGKNL
jgi:dienelactone hydrolase